MTQLPNNPQDDFDRQFREALTTAQPRVDFERLQRSMLQRIEAEDSHRAGWRGWDFSFFAILHDVSAASLAVGVAALIVYGCSWPNYCGPYQGTVQLYQPLQETWVPSSISRMPENVLVRVISPNCLLTLDDGSQLQMNDGTMLRFEHNRGDTVELFRGRLEAEIKPRTPNNLFHVKMPNNIELTVVGTRFVVEVEDAP